MVTCREFLQRKDIAYAASFEPKDAERVQNEMNKIDHTHGDPKSFFKQFDKVYDDHRLANFEPIKVLKAGNKLLNEGLIALAEMQMGRRTKIFSVYGIGEGTTPVNIRQFGLVNQVGPRLDIRQNGGTITNRQSTCYYSVFFPKTTDTCTISETAIFDKLLPQDDRVLLRTLFPNGDYLEHRKDRDTIFVAHIIYSGSV